jgi:hypothetical protein
MQFLAFNPVPRDVFVESPVGGEEPCVNEREKLSSLNHETVSPTKVNLQTQESIVQLHVKNRCTSHLLLTVSSYETFTFPDTQFNLNVKNAWKIYDRRREKWFLLCAKTAEEKTKWLNAFRKERKRVKEDRYSGFAFSEQTKRIAQQSVKYKVQQSAGNYIVFSDQITMD